MFGLPTQRDRQHVLHEYNPTNYSVVNINTIESVSTVATTARVRNTYSRHDLQLYEVMYHQKLLDGIKARTGRDESSYTRITLHPHTSIYSADLVSPTPGSSSQSDAIRLTLHGVLTRAVTQKTYDAVFCGTGYDRDSWTRLLASSNLAEHFGIKSSSIELVAESEAAPSMPPLFADLDDMDSRGSSSSTSTDGFSTPPTPDTPHSHHSPLAGGAQRAKVRISRTYRLLSDRESRGEPASPNEARVYLQGCTQSTHGLSESLLSILGVRAGLVVDDLCGTPGSRSRSNL